MKKSIKNVLGDLTLDYIIALAKNELNHDYLLVEKKRLLNKWNHFAQEYGRLDPDEKVFYLGKDIFIFSLFNDEEVISLMNKLKVSENVTNYFVNSKSLFKSIQEFLDMSKFNWSVEILLTFYYLYSIMFLNKKLIKDLGLNLNLQMLGLKRRESKAKLADLEFDLLNVLIHEQKGLIKKDLDAKVPYYKGDLANTLKKFYNFPHKFYYNIIYNQNISESSIVFEHKKDITDYKCEFFKLADLTFRDKETLWGKEEDALELTYGIPGNRRFRAKRVEQLFLNLSENYSI